MQRRVLVAEKPSVARDLARFLRADRRGEGCLRGDEWTVTWAIGHLAELKPPDEYAPELKRWTLETLPFVPEHFELRPTGDASARRQLEIVLELVRDAEDLVCATDAGREGELIFRYLLDLAGCAERPFRRLWLSSLTDAAIRTAFAALRPSSEYENLHAAARSRAEADWIVGINGTRAHTVRHGSAFGRERVLWSVGRVQTPVLALVARRDDEIRTFRPETFFELRTRYRDVLFRFAGERFTERQPAEAALARAGGHPLHIDHLETKRESQQPPLLHDLTALQRDMNLRHGLAAAHTLKIAQELYEKKLLTYPRTDSRHLTGDMHGEIARALRELRPWNDKAVSLLDIDVLPRPRRVFDDQKVSDHHAIVPTGRVPQALGEDERRVFDAIATRLVQVFLPDCEEDVTVVLASADAVPFRARGTRVVQTGWSALEPKSRKRGKKGGEDADDGEDDGQELPPFVVGESGPHVPDLHEGSTKPPRPYTENTLLAAMETAGRLVDDEAMREALKARGLGTPATRASILETLIARRYVQREKKALRITDLGRFLVASVVDPQLKSAELTGEWEQKLQDIEAGRRSRSEFMAEIGAYARQLVAGPVALARDELGRCPRCRATVIQGRQGYGCSRWQEGCHFVLWREYRGATIEPREAAELLTRRVLLRPKALAEVGPRILCMTEQGMVIDVAVPTRAAQEGRAQAPAEKAPPVRGTAMPACPRCSRPLVVGERGYGCSGWRDGCRFVVWKTIAGKAVTKAALATLIAQGKTRVASGFTDETGSACRGRLVLEETGARFERDADRGAATDTD